MCATQVNTICLMEKANRCVNAGSPGSVVWVVSATSGCWDTAPIVKFAINRQA